MALFRKNPFTSAIKQYHFYEAFQEYLVDEDGCEMPAAANVPEYKVDFRVFGTARQLDRLKAYMQKNGIRFMPVPQE